jgi:hypothetical protein
VHKLIKDDKEGRISGIHKLDFPKGRGYSTRAVVYVPNTEIEKPIPRKQYYRRVKSTVDYLSKLFGGTTRVSGSGTWYDDKGNKIKDRVMMVESFSTPKDYKEKDELLEAWVKNKSKEWKQKGGVSFEFESPTKKNTTLYFVK